MHFRLQEATFWNSGLCCLLAAQPQVVLLILYFLSQWNCFLAAICMCHIVLVVDICQEVVQSLAGWLNTGLCQFICSIDLLSALVFGLEWNPPTFGPWGCLITAGLTHAWSCKYLSSAVWNARCHHLFGFSMCCSLRPKNLQCKRKVLVYILETISWKLREL